MFANLALETCNPRYTHAALCSATQDHTTLQHEPVIFSPPREYSSQGTQSTEQTGIRAAEESQKGIEGVAELRESDP